MSRTGDPYPLVRSPWGWTTPAPDLSPAEAEIVAAFEAAPTPPEVVEAQEALAAVTEALLITVLGTDDRDFLTGCDLPADEIARLIVEHGAAAAVAAYRATQDGGAEEAVRRAANWLCKEYGELLDGDAEGPAGYWEFQARELLEALAPQAGDGAR